VKTNVGVASVFRRHCLGASLLVLAGCVSGVDENLYGGVSYRDQSAPIGVSSRYDYARMQGTWFVRRLTPDDLEPRSMVFHEQDNAKGTVHELRGTCPAEIICEQAFQEYVIDDTSGGALTLHRNPPGPDRKFVVHWIDEGHRTMAVGAPNGRYAWVLDRAHAGGRDRIAAALEILKFYGYDTSVMRAIRQGKVQ